MTAFAAGVLVLMLSLSLAGPAAGADKDCSDFSSWRQAQRFYKRHGGPKYDPHRLDGDDDGIACERLR